MQIIEFSQSSSISKIALKHEDNEVGIAFTSKPEQFYFFQCNDVGNFVDVMESTINSEGSLGKMVSSMRKEGILISM
jgi:hypothetical protein